MCFGQDELKKNKDGCGKLCAKLGAEIHLLGVPVTLINNILFTHIQGVVCYPFAVTGFFFEIFMIVKTRIPIPNPPTKICSYGVRENVVFESVMKSFGMVS